MLTTDLVQESPAASGAYFADYSGAFRVPSGRNKYLVGRLHVPFGSSTPTWVPTSRGHQ